MIAVDTNVLVRILIDDPEEIVQTETARKLAKEAGRVYVPQIVQVESVWVLESCYKFEKTKVIGILEHIQENRAFILQRHDIFQSALQSFKTSTADFADCLILAESQQFKVPLYTFDKRCGKLTGTHWIKTEKP